MEKSQGKRFECGSGAEIDGCKAKKTGYLSVL
jgi:hypothetical protein